MPRWTKDQYDLQQIARINTLITSDRLMFGPVRISLHNGTVIVGHTFGASVRNNADQAISGRAAWSYCGALKVRTAAGDLDIDYLDIANIEPMPRENRTPEQST